jgi:hypothetical protein
MPRGGAKRPKANAGLAAQEPAGPGQLHAGQLVLPAPAHPSSSTSSNFTPPVNGCALPGVSSTNTQLAGLFDDLNTAVRPAEDSLDRRSSSAGSLPVGSLDWLHPYR